MNISKLQRCKYVNAFLTLSGKKVQKTKALLIIILFLKKIRKSNIKNRVSESYVVNGVNIHKKISSICNAQTTENQALKNVNAINNFCKCHLQR